MINKILLILIACLLLIRAFGWFFPDHEIMLRSILSLGIAEWLGLMMMMINGTFMERSYYKVVYVLIVFILLSTAFKIMHWRGAYEMRIMALMSVPVLYSFHFFSKESKIILDVLKLLTVYSFFLIPILIDLHFIPAQYEGEANLISSGLLWFTFLYFIVTSIKSKTLFR